MTEIIVIGGANLDIKAKSLLSNHLGTSNPGRVETSPGGVGRNIAHNLARLGCRVGLITVIGADHQGSVVLKDTQAAGVDISRIAQTAPATGTYIAILNPDGELLTALNDMRAADAISPELVEGFRSDIIAAKFVVADCNLPLDTLLAVAEIARDKLLVEPVSVPKSAKLLALLEAGHIFMASPNIDQIESLTGTRDIDRGCEALHQLGLRSVVVHAGSAGAYVSSATGIEHLPVQPHGAVVDVTGAGDAAVAGLMYGLLRGDDLRAAARRGQILAGRVVASARSTLE